jgi:hypothetical protein
MRLAHGIFAALVAAAAEPACAQFEQNFELYPVGTAVLSFQEKLKIGGCGSSTGRSTLVLTVNSDGTWLVETPGGDLTGTMTLVPGKWTVWTLRLDDPSAAAYEAYLASAASELCGEPVALLGAPSGRFQLKFKRLLDGVTLRLKTSAPSSTAYAAGRGSHSITAQGAFD